MNFYDELKARSAGGGGGGGSVTTEDCAVIYDTSTATPLYSTEIPYGANGAKVLARLQQTEDYQAGVISNQGFTSDSGIAYYNSEEQIGAYAGYQFASPIEIAKLRIWLGRYTYQNKTLTVHVQYKETADSEWANATALEITTDLPYPLNYFDVPFTGINKSVIAVRWIHDETNKSDRNDVTFSGMTVFQRRKAVVE